MSRKRLPDETHRLRGTLRADRHLVSVISASGRIRRTGGLCPRASELWGKFRPYLSWLRAADAPVFAVFCELFAQFEAAPGEMSAAKIAQLRALAESLGLSPTSRARLAMPPIRPPGDGDDGDDDEGEAFAAYLAGRPRRMTD